LCWDFKTQPPVKTSRKSRILRMNDFVFADMVNIPGISNLKDN